MAGGVCCRSAGAREGGGGACGSTMGKVPPGGAANKERRPIDLPRALSYRDLIDTLLPRVHKEGGMKKTSRFTFLYIVLALIVLFIIQRGITEDVYALAYSEFKQHLLQGHVQEVQIGPQITGRMLIPPGEEAVSRPPIGGRKKPLPEAKSINFSTQAVQDPTLVPLLDGMRIPYEEKPESDLNFYLPVLMALGVVGIFLFLMMRQSGQGARAALMFGRSKARLYAEKIKSVTFDDVAGCEEAKEELKEVVDFLRSPKKYQSLGARIPKGVLLVGPPGTGKTLIARAVAGEAKTPFFSLSGSEFVEMFVGVGAARVRDLFQQAKDSAPCIIFVDELDALGRARVQSPMGSHEER